MTKKFDLYQLRFQTSVAQEDVERRIKALENYKLDPKKDDRIKVRKCLACYYIWGTGMGVDSKFEWTCRGCGELHKGYGRSVPTLCDSCSDKFDCCKKCGADRELRERRTLERKK